MTNEASAALDVRGPAGRFAAALEAGGFDFERPSLEAALRGYEEWLRKPVRGLTWGESDCAIVVMEPELDGTCEIDLRRHVGEPDGGEPSIGLILRFAPDRSPALCSQWGTSTRRSTTRLRSGSAARSDRSQRSRLRSARTNPWPPSSGSTAFPSRSGNCLSPAWSGAAGIPAPRAEAARGRQDAVRQDRPKAAASAVLLTAPSAGATRRSVPRRSRRADRGVACKRLPGSRCRSGAPARKAAKRPPAAGAGGGEAAALECIRNVASERARRDPPA
jgi:hypothetical protein